MNYQAVLFDLDGVIVNSEPIHLIAFKTTLARHGYTLMNDDYNRYFAGKSDQAGFEQYFAATKQPVNMPAIMAEKAKVYEELSNNKLVAYPGIVSLIQELANSVPLALVTGSLRAEAELALKTLGIARQFTAIVAADDVSRSKPDPEGYRKAAELLNVSPRGCIVVEDAPHGVAAAKAAGMRSIAITNTYASSELREATKIVSRLTLADFENLV